MPSSTTRWAIPYPLSSEPPDGPGAYRSLAEKVDTSIQPFSCTSTTRPTGVPAGFQIWETDTKTLGFWDGTAWHTMASANATSYMSVRPTSDAFGTGVWTEIARITLPATALAGRYFVQGTALWALSAPGSAVCYLNIQAQAGAAITGDLRCDLTGAASLTTVARHYDHPGGSKVILFQAQVSAVGGYVIAGTSILMHMV